MSAATTNPSSAEQGAPSGAPAPGRPILRVLGRVLPSPRSRATVAVGALAAAAALAGWAIHSGRATDWSGFDRAQAAADIARSRDFLRMVRQAKEKRGDLEARLAAVRDATLGDRPDVVDGALRARMNRIAQETGLLDLIVATGQVVERRNPGRQEMTRLGMPRALRDEPDFMEVRATLSGEGAADQVLRLVHRVTVDPMVKRVESVSFTPVKDGARVRVTMRLATIFMPGLLPDGMPGAPSAEALAGFSKYAALVQRNPFRLPDIALPPAAAPAVAAAPAAGPAPAPAAPATPEAVAGFPYGQWLLTGIIDGPAGTEAWFRNSATHEARALRVSDSIAEFALVGITSQGAQLAAGGANYLLRVGDSLEARAILAPEKQ